jgi:hypothetical protein
MVSECRYNFLSNKFQVTYSDLRLVSLLIVQYFPLLVHINQAFYNLLFEQINMGFFIKLIKNVIYLIMKNENSDSIVFLF